jgi:transglutaminase-like putative cysteine protease
MLLRISHETKLSYTSPVAETVFEVRMAPPTDDDQTNLGYRLRTTPQATVTPFRDGMGNRVDMFNVTKPYQQLVILATSYVRTHRRPGPSRLQGLTRLGEGEVGIDAIELLQPSPLVDKSEALDQFVASLPQLSEATSAVGFLETLMEAVRDRLIFEPEVTKVRTPVSEALTLGRGVCQDIAHLFIAACRGLGLPARYVSGYVNHPGEIATHAWCQIWGGDRVGWVDVDPTDKSFVADDHVAIAFGRDYSDVPPNKGQWRGQAEETISVVVNVEPVDRVPMEWNEWSLPNPRAGMLQSQRMGNMFQSQRSGRSPYPNQRPYGAGLHQQQGEQQQ